MSTKLSVCLAYHNLFKRGQTTVFRVTRFVVYAIAALVVGYYSAALFVSTFQCSPVSKSWWPKTPGHCIDNDNFRFYTAAANILTSVLIIAAPLPALYTWQHTKPEVTEVMVLILLGLM